MSEEAHVRLVDEKGTSRRSPAAQPVRSVDIILLTSSFKGA